MAQENLGYNYAMILENTNMCYHIRSRNQIIENNHTAIEVAFYSKWYLGKYYKNGKWYQDEAFTVELTPATGESEDNQNNKLTKY